MLNLCRSADFDSQVSKPFFATLQRWIFSGDLHDPFQDFFVQLNPDMSLRDGRMSPYQTGDAGFEGGIDTGGGLDEAHKLWEKQYVFVKGMVPGFVSEEFGRKVSRVIARFLGRAETTEDLFDWAWTQFYPIQLSR